MKYVRRFIKIMASFAFFLILGMAILLPFAFPWVLIGSFIIGVLVLTFHKELDNFFTTWE
jgi:hypothetical protein